MTNSPDLADLLASIKAARNEQQRLRIEPVDLGPAGGEFFASVHQDRLWRVQSADRQSDSLNVRFLFLVEGHLHLSLLERAFTQVRERHSALRTTFVEREGKLYQRIAPPSAFVMENLAAEVEQAGEPVLSAMRVFSCRPFLLDQEVLRAGYYRESEDRCWLCWVFHHVIVDGWSLQILFDELSAAYARLAAGDGGSHREAPLQYAAYSEWERRYYKSPEARQHLAELGEYLQGLPEREILAGSSKLLDRRGATPVRSFAIPEEITRALDRLALESHLSIANIHLGAYLLTLAAITGREALSVSTTIANRGVPEWGGIVGLFANVMTLGVRLADFATLGELLKGIQRSAWLLFEYQHVPEQLVPASPKAAQAGSTGSASSRHAHFAFHNFENVLDHGDTAAGTLVLPGCVVRQIPLYTGKPRFGLSLHVVRERGGTTVTLESDPEGVDDAFADHLMQVLEGMLRALPTGSARRIPELLRAYGGFERIRALGAGEMVASSCGTIVDAFRRRVAESPAKIALWDTAGRHVSYGELMRLGDGVAARLRDAGVGRGAIVLVVCAEPAHAIIAMLGVLSVGAAYMPAELDEPIDRIRWRLMDASAVAILTDTGAAPTVFPLRESVEQFLLVEECPPRADASAHDVILCADDLAYAMYTSGSTGQAKGVMVTHRNVLRLVEAPSFLRVTESDVFLQLAPLSFDASTFEIWVPLLGGGSLICLPRGVEGIARLECTLKERPVSILWLTGAVFRQVIDSYPDSLRNLRHLVAGGEALSHRHVVKANALMPRGSVINGYGPTECTTFSCTLDTGRVDLTRWSTVPIGRPIQGTQLYVLSPDLALLPPGVAGELCVAGPGVARGYLARPGLTAQAFIPDPFSSVPGARMYRTGDLVKWGEDGLLIFLGRSDRQIKIRGYRIELDEIEIALESLPEVHSAVVFTVQRPDDQKLIQALVVPARGQPLSSADLKDRLRTRLPHYMLPSHIGFVEALPTTPNGKIDRESLIGLIEEVPIEATEAPRAPADPLEAKILESMRHVLGRGELDIESDFFSAGGDSLLAITWKLDLEKRGLSPRIEDIMAHASARALARCLHQVPAKPPWVLDAAYEPFSLLPSGVAAAPLRARGCTDAYPMTQLQQMMLLESALDGPSGTYHDVIQYRLRLLFSAEALRAVLASLATRHEVLRTHLDLDAAVPLQLVRTFTEIPVAITDLSGLAGLDQAESLARWRREETRRGFDWTKAPLLRVHVHRVGEAEFVLALSFHHAILDGWSESILVQELVTDYRRALESSPFEARPALPPYAGYIRAELAALASLSTREFWRSLLEGCRPFVVGRGARGRSGRGKARAHLVVSPETRAALARLSAVVRCGERTLLLAAYLRTLALFAETEDITMGTITHGRLDQELSDHQVGLFLNVSPFRIDLRRESWQAFATRVLQRELEIHPHRRLPLPEVQRVTGLRPLVNASFNYTNFRQYKALLAQAAGDVLERDGFAENSIAFAMGFMVEDDDRLVGSLAYERATLTEPEAQRFVALLARQISDLAEHPNADCPMPLGSAQANASALASMSIGAPLQIGLPTIHAYFDEAARRVPDRVALTSAERTVIYREVARQSDGVAQALIAAGVPTEGRVALFMPRSIEQIIGILGILKSGAAYVPIDPETPPERIAFILEDARPTILLTEACLVGRLPRGVPPSLLIDQVLSEAHASVTSLRPPVVSPGNLAYVIYTSGSTGRPKGVMVTHRNLTNYVEFCRVRFGEPEAKTFGALASVATDLGNTALFVSLCSGGALHVFPESSLVDGAQLERARLDCLKVVPSHYRALGHGMDDVALAPSKTLIFGGERLDASWCAALAERLPNLSIFNHYGPTETTIGVCTYSLSSDGPEPNAATIPIGYAIGNTAVYLLDTALVPVPRGAVGEIFIGGEAVGRGYMARPGLTADRFVPDPFSSVPGGRLYRTGDLGIMHPSGAIEFLGRTDDQVKIRGHRVEIAEVEGALERLPEVLAAAVLPVTGSGGKVSLEAQVVLRAGARLDLEPTRRALGASLPHHMVPSQIRVRQELPRLINGKIDRTALREEASFVLGGEPSGASAPVVPAGPGSGDLLSGDALVIGRIWCAELRRSSIHRDDDYFELGGDSLGVIRVVGEVNRRLGVRATFKDLYENPRLSDFAAQVVATRPALGGPSIVPFRWTSKAPLVVLVHPIGGDVLCYRRLADAIPDSFDVVGVQREELSTLDPPAELSVTELAAQHVQALLTIPGQEPFLLVGWSFGGILALAMARQLIASGREVRFVGLIDSALALPSELEAPPLDGGHITPFAQSHRRAASTFRPDFAIERCTLFEASYTREVLGEARAQDLQRLVRTPLRRHLIEGTHESILFGEESVSLGLMLKAELLAIEAEAPMNMSPWVRDPSFPARPEGEALAPASGDLRMPVSDPTMASGCS